ncbi:MAG: class I SAM-dependent RNA methyltransferase [Treponema sp.]|nr:class I SAM-dependent RNA methyltransferase [Treponema sp.]
MKEPKDPSGPVFTGLVESIAAGGAGIIRQDGRPVFVELTAPQDRISYVIRRDHSSWAEGDLLEVLSPSPQRVPPACPLYSRCGGCSLQHLSYEAQVDAKTRILRDTFERIGGLSPPIHRIRPSSPYGYRNRLQLHRIPETGELGLMERRSKQPVALEDCPVADPGIRQALKAGTFKRESGPERFNVYAHLDTLLWEGGLQEGQITIKGKTLFYDVKVFFQSNAAMLELLIDDLLEAASSANSDLPLADIYSGIGTFAAFLEGLFSGVTVVEENPAALALARRNLGSAKAEYAALRDSAWVKKLSPGKNPWGLMVLDPPRQGLSAPLSSYLAQRGPEHIAYVSCDCATLARDSRVLVNGGYTLHSLGLYDFYPQTAHIESLALFHRTNKSA